MQPILTARPTRASRVGDNPALRTPSRRRAEVVRACQATAGRRAKGPTTTADAGGGAKGAARTGEAASGRHARRVGVRLHSPAVLVLRQCARILRWPAVPG